ncbi:YbaL family putative K(+) efflux transporter [Azospirillum doebereinerae]|uniref:Kef family K(+) transporter n=1 Tax=Azospirillum doebereinerae TaxID=92933 RepID=A0A433J8L5_9PROT|nr:YbaL family putative K(+) efflux transporter [Azospirillum doebereinerae]MCG5239879.1 Kef family K(+) transporter [Azospirillum doebereinerae]RUQ70697.1 Kef family K(+) transporter [Azospirillum doebereinerae]
MPHHVPLITTMVAALVLAFILGATAHRLRLSPLVGYLLAGVAMGPFTPGYVGDLHLASQLAEIGVILLMFGVGLHFSLGDLMKVRAIAVPGAIVQITIATLMGWGLAALLGWSLAAGLVFGLALSVASTVVLLRALEQLDLFRTERGRIAIGWLIVEDLAMVLALVLLPPVARMLESGANGGGMEEGLLLSLAITLGKVALFVALMLVGGRRAVPWVLGRIARTGSRELFTLAVLAIALGIAYGSAELFSVSFALGAFFAGMVLSESDLSHRAAEQTLPLQDAFAVLFFVSVGMLFDPMVLVRSPWSVAATVAIILLGKSVAAFGLVLLFRYPMRTALTVAISLAQIGEFSFILVGLGTSLGIMPEEGQGLVLAGALLSITANPFLFALIQKFYPADPVGTPATDTLPELRDYHDVTGHAIVVGYGRVGRHVTQKLVAEGRPCVVVDLQRERAKALQNEGLRVVYGNAIAPGILQRAGVEGAALLLVTVPDALEGGGVVEHARGLNPRIAIAARAHSDEAVTYLGDHGADTVFMGEREIARRMIEYAQERQAAADSGKPEETKRAPDTDSPTDGTVSLA